MTELRRRRGRPPASAAVIEAAVAEITAETTGAPTKRRRRSKVGGSSMKLAAPTRPGFVRRWFNDSGNRIAEAEELGYEHVSDPEVEKHSLGSRISRRVGTSPDGKGQNAFLMECPDELYAEGDSEREAIHSRVDQAIVEGAVSSDLGSSDGAYGHGSIQVRRTG